MAIPAPIPRPQPRREPSFVAIEKIKQLLRARRKGRKANIRVAALNITSFLDMSFCLLMFLTLSAGGASNREGSFTSTLSGPDIIKPGASDAIPVIERPITLTVSERAPGRYVIEVDALSTSVASFESLTRTLTDLRTSGVYTDTSPIIIRPGRDVPWQGVISAFNAAVRARFKNVGFASGGQSPRLR